MTGIVVDTNTSVSALLWGGTPQRVLAVAIDQSIPLLISKQLIQELESTLAKPRLAKYVVLTGKTPSDLVSQLISIMTLIEPVDVPADAVRDPDDVKVLAAAVGGKATHIVSGDKDLLTLGVYQDIRIMSALQFIQEIEAGP